MEGFTDDWDCLFDTNPNSLPQSKERSTKAKLKVVKMPFFQMPPVDKLVNLQTLSLGKNNSYHTLYNSDGASMIEVAAGLMPQSYPALMHCCFILRGQFNWELITDEAGYIFLVPTRK